MTLNWRHKAGLFLTLVAVGCGLFLDLSAKQAVGIALLGIAFSWLIGSLSARVLTAAFAIVLCGVGLYLAVYPVWSDRQSTTKSIVEYDVAMDDFQYAIKTAPIPIPPDATIGKPSVDYNALAKKYGGTTDRNPDIDWSKYSTPATHLAIGVAKGQEQTRTVTVPETVKRWVRPEQKTRNWFGTHSDANIMVEFPSNMSEAEVMRAFTASFLLPRPAFSRWSAVRAHAWWIFGSFVLFIFGLSILGWSFRGNRESN